MTQVLGNLNLSLNQLQNHVVHKGTVFPTSPTPVQGQLFFRTDENKLYFYTGSTWTAVGTGAGGLGKYVASFTSQTSVTVTHNLNDSNPVVEIYDNNAQQIDADSVIVTNANVVTLTFNVATTGFCIVHAGVGIATGVTAYYTQGFISQTSVAVPHALNQKYVAVKVYDSGDSEIEPATVVLTDANNLTVTFGSSTTGTIVVVGGSTGGTAVTGIQILASDPGSPTTGQVWFNSTDSQFKGYNGTSIVILG